MKPQLIFSRIPLLLLAIVWLLALAACRPQEQNLPFETIAQGDGFPSGRSYSGEEPDFLVITRSEEVDTLELNVQFTSELAKQLRTLDYERSFVVALFRGAIGARSPKYAIDTLQFIRSDSEIVLKVHLGEPEPNSIVLPAFSSPYQIVMIAKKDQWAQNVHFVLEVDGQEVKDRSYFIP